MVSRRTEGAAPTKQKRLFYLDWLRVPLVVGILLFSPLQAYFEALNHGTFAGSFLQFVPWFVEHIQFSWHSPWISIPYHLWFLEFLWVFSLIALPLFLFLRGAAGSRAIDTLAACCTRPGVIFLFILPIALIRVTLGAAFSGENDWATFVYYLTFFVYGYLLFSRPSFAEAIRRQGWIALGIGLLCFLLIGATYAAGYLETWYSPSYTAGSLLFQLLLSIFVWAWIVFILSCGIRWLNFNRKRLSEANEAVLPFYVLHQPAIVLIAFYVVQWDMGILPKWLIISTLALALILAVYVLLIRRVNAMRWLFGMKPRKPTPRRDSNGREQEGPLAEVLGGKTDQAVPPHPWKEDLSETRSDQSDEHAFTG